VAIEASRPPVRLDFRKSGTCVSLSWQNALAGYHLETTTNLTPPVTWTLMPDAPIFVRGQNVVSNEVSDPCRYYRLVK
jgi:hypothetical protein